MNLLLNKGADVGVTDKDGVTTLMSAASHGHAEVNCKSQCTELWLSQNTFGVQVLQLVHPNWEEFGGSHRPSTKWCIECCTNWCTNPPYCSDVRRFVGILPPEQFPNNRCPSIRGCSRQACKVLLDAGAPLDVKASSGGTALMFAAAAGYTDVVNLLLEKGADPNASVKV